MTSFTGSNHPDAATDVGFLRRSDTQDFSQNVSYRWWPDTWIINKKMGRRNPTEDHKKWTQAAVAGALGVARGES